MRFRAGVAGAACALVLSGVLALPAGAQTKEVVPKLEPTATAAEACELIFGKSAFTKAPSEGEVSPGEPVSVDITWGSGFAEDATVEVVGCTALDNKFSEELSTRIRRVKNDGLFVHEFTIPDDAAKGAKLCEQAIVLGKSESGAARAEKLDADCFTVAGGSTKSASPAKTEAAAPKPASKESVKETAAPKAEAAAKAAPAKAAPAKAAAAAPKPTVVAGATETKKATGAAPAPATAPAPAPALARTGSGDHLLMVAAGLMLAIGGLSVAFSKPVRAMARR